MALQSKKKREFTRPKIKRGFSEGLQSFLQEEKSNFLPDLHLEVLDDRQAVLEGVRGVLGYSETQVSLSCGRRVVTFLGSGLQLRCISASAAVVTGIILEIRYGS